MNRYDFTKDEDEFWSKKTNSFEGPPKGKVKGVADLRSVPFSECRASRSKTDFIGRCDIDLLDKYLRWITIVEDMFKVDQPFVKIKAGEKDFHFLWKPNPTWRNHERINIMQCFLVITEPWGRHFLNRFFEIRENSTLDVLGCIEVFLSEANRASDGNHEFENISFRFTFGSWLKGMPYLTRSPYKEYLKDEYYSVYPFTRRRTLVRYEEPVKVDTFEEKYELYAKEQILTCRLADSMLEATSGNTHLLLDSSEAGRIPISQPERLTKNLCGCYAYVARVGTSNRLSICEHERIFVTLKNKQELFDIVEKNRSNLLNYFKSKLPGSILDYPLLVNALSLT